MWIVVIAVIAGYVGFLLGVNSVMNEPIVE